MEQDATILSATDALLEEPAAAPSSPDQELDVGSVVNRRFVIEGILGRGGMGVVYRARDLRKEETGDRDPYVALKVLSDEFRRNPKMVVALQREARKAQSLAHPNIATVYDFDRDDHLVYLTMEQLDGQPLDEVIAAHPEGMEREKALKILRGLCLALAYAHNKNIIHSDFKPGNIFLTSAGQTKILDFGIARAAPVERVETSEVTQFDAGELGALTPSYAAPEMFLGQEPHPADDVYALAVVAYQLFSGRHPFDNVPSIQAQPRGMEPKPLKGLKRREWRAIRRGLAFNRDERTPHAAAFLRELEGGSRLKMVAALTVTLAVLFAGYVGYVEFQERARALPDIPFAELPADVQMQIARRLEEAEMLRRFGDPGSALTMYREAYEMHPRNPDVVAELEELLSELADKAVAAGQPTDLKRLRENFDAVMATDDFLANRPALSAARERVAAAR